MSCSKERSLPLKARARRRRFREYLPPRGQCLQLRSPAKAERGTLRPAVVEILKKNEKPLKTADIYDALVTKGYQFTFKEPKKVLGIRLYKMLGVQVLGGGLFKAK